ncbi:MAG: sensor histidine kinase [Thermonemataceae bacterium]
MSTFSIIKPSKNTFKLSFIKKLSPIILLLFWPTILYAQEVDSRSEVENIVLNIGIAVLFVLVFLTLMAFLQKRKTSQKLEDQNEVIKSQTRELSKANQEFLKQNLRLETILHEKNSIVGIITHDLKMTFNRIISLAELVQLDGGETLNPNQQEYLARMKQVVQDGLAVIQNLLDSRVIEDYKKDINIERLDVKENILEVVKRYQPYASSKRIQIIFKSNVPELEFRTDAFFLNRIMDNLLSNAIKFSPPERKVYVNLKDEREKVHIEVRDEGYGIPEEDQEKLFLKHQNFTNKPTGGESSAGLGLSIVKTLVEELNGKVWAETNRGKGATFYVEFPKIIIER